jgi:hypothetical protein
VRPLSLKVAVVAIAVGLSVKSQAWLNGMILREEILGADMGSSFADAGSASTAADIAAAPIAEVLMKLRRLMFFLMDINDLSDYSATDLLTAETRASTGEVCRATAFISLQPNCLAE